VTETEISANGQKTITDYFPIRRSIRKTGKTVLEEKRQTIQEAILSHKEDGLEVRTKQ
jgi:histone-lysine N-methyltransferase SETD8